MYIGKLSSTKQHIKVKKKSWNKEWIWEQWQKKSADFIFYSLIIQ